MIANLLTAVRFLLALPAAMAFARPEFISPLLLLGLLLVAIVTDYFDGIVARRAHAASPRGQLYDHTTDFVFVTAGLGGAAAAGEVSVALPILIAVAFSQYVIDSYWLYREKQLRMSSLGRLNGIMYFVPLMLIALSRVEVMPGHREVWTVLIMSLGYALLFSTVVSIIDRAVAPRRSGATESERWETRPRRS